MPDTFATIRPTTAYDVIASWYGPGGNPPFPGGWDDNNDATFWATAITDGAVILDLADIAFPALAIVHSATVRVRASNGTSVAPTPSFEALLVNSSLGSQSVGRTPDLDATIRTYTLESLVSIDGVALTPAEINAMRLELIARFGTDQNAYELYVDVAYNQAPFVTGFSINSSASPQPVFTLPYSDPEGDLKERHQIAVFTSAQSDPFNNLDAAIWYSGEVYTADTVQRCDVRLVNNTAYHAYGRATDVGSGGRYGPTETISWTTSFIAPIGAPVLSIPYGDASTASVENLVAQARLNLLATNQADLETDTSGWAAAGNCTIAQGTPPIAALRGSHALNVASVAAGNMTAQTTLVSVQGGLMYTGLLAVTPGSGINRVVQVVLSFYDVSNVLLDSVEAQATSIDGRWVTPWVTSRAPANATHAKLALLVIGTGGAAEHHWIDAAALLIGTVNPIENSDFEEGSTLWNLVDAGVSNAALVSGVGAFGSQYVLLNKADTNNAQISTPYYLGVQSGEKYILSLSVFVNSVSAGTTQLTVEMIGQDGASLTGSDVVTGVPVGQWQRVSFTITPQVGKTAAYVIISAGDRYDATSRVWVYVDGIQLQKVDSGLVNGGFETSFNGDYAARQDHFDGRGWMAETHPDLVIMAAIIIHSGAQSLRLGGNAGDIAAGSWNTVSQDIYCCGCTSLDLSYWWNLQNVRASQARVTFYDAGRQVIGPRAVLVVPAGAVDNGTSVFAPIATDSSGTTGWLNRSFAGIPIPAGAAWVNVAFMGGRSFDGINPGYTWVDDVAVTLHGTVTGAAYTPGGWSAGGYAVPGHLLLIERSNDGGGSWYPVRINDVLVFGYPVSDSPWRVGTTDYEAMNGATALYQVTSLVPFNDGYGTLTPSPSWVISVSTPAVRRLWIKDPRDHTRNHTFYTRRPGVVFDAQERQVVKQTLGSTDVVVIADTIQTEDLSIPLVCMNGIDLSALYLLRSGQRTLLVQNHLGYQWYVRLGTSAPVTILDDAPVTDVPFTGLPQLPPPT